MQPRKYGSLRTVLLGANKEPEWLALAYRTQDALQDGNTSDAITVSLLGVNDALGNHDGELNMNYARLVQLWNQDGLRLTRDDGGTFKLLCRAPGRDTVSANLISRSRKEALRHVQVATSLEHLPKANHDQGDDSEEAVRLSERVAQLEQTIREERDKYRKLISTDQKQKAQAADVSRLNPSRMKRMRPDGDDDGFEGDD